LYATVYFFTSLEQRKKIHRGALLEAAVKESGTNITKLVKRMGIARGTYYNHKNDPNLSLEQLAAYGKVLRHDFSDDIPEMKRYVVEESESPYTPKTIAEAIAQRDQWREKYYQLMEQYLKLLEEHRLK